QGVQRADLPRLPEPGPDRLLLRPAPLLLARRRTRLRTAESPQRPGRAPGQPAAAGPVRRPAARQRPGRDRRLRGALRGHRLNRRAAPTAAGRERRATMRGYPYAERISGERASARTGGPGPAGPAPPRPPAAGPGDPRLRDRAQPFARTRRL